MTTFTVETTQEALELFESGQATKGDHVHVTNPGKNPMPVLWGTQLYWTPDEYDQLEAWAIARGHESPDELLQEIVAPLVRSLLQQVKPLDSSKRKAA